MEKTRLIAAVASTALAVGVTIATTAGVALSDAPTPAVDVLTPVAFPLISQQAGDYLGKWAVEGRTVAESFERDGIVISTGTTPLQDGLGADEIVSFGFVAGYGDLSSGDSFAQLSGQAGADVTAVRVVSASGIVTPAVLADGVWGAVWIAGTDPGEYGAATLQFDTPAGTRTVSTDEVDVIAAAAR